MKRHGFTLIEMLLALALSAVLLGLLGMAVSIHLRVADTSRGVLEGALTARIAIEQIAEDLRNTIPVTSIPYVAGGIVGDSRSLQMEISHMPLLGSRGMESNGEVRLAGAPPSDVRIVHYRVDAADDGTQDRRRGLMRIECERAALAWATQQGEAGDLDRLAKVLAPDVEKIEFTYFDGATEYVEWDSLQQGKLPTAVRVAVAVRPRESNIKRTSAGRTTEETSLTVYEELVDLPNFRSTLQRMLAEVSSQATSTSGGSQPTGGTEK